MEEMQWKWMNEVPIERFPEPYQTMAREIGLRNTLKLAKRFAGTGMYFPKLDDIMIGIRNEKIRTEFNGGNYKELARKYDITERWVYEILKTEVNHDQVSLF